MANQFFVPFNFHPASVDVTNSATTSSSQYARVTPTDVSGASLVIDGNTVIERTHYDGSWSTGSTGVKYTNSTQYTLMLTYTFNSTNGSVTHQVQNKTTTATGLSMYNPYSNTTSTNSTVAGGSAVLAPGDFIRVSATTGTNTVYYSAWAIDATAALNRSFWVPPSVTVTATEFYIEYFNIIS